MSTRETLGFENGKNIPLKEEELVKLINLKLLAHGLPHYEKIPDSEYLKATGNLICKIRSELVSSAAKLCPADSRIQNFLNKNFSDSSPEIRLPAKTFRLDRFGVARTLSLPPDRDYYISKNISSYRTKQGILNNPASDRRTTKGSFHVSEGGFPITADKITVPKDVFGKLLHNAFSPPLEDLELPFTSTQEKKAHTFVSLYIKPIVSPEVPGVSSEKRMEVRFFVPGSLVSSLDFIESIFGNAGDPGILDNDAAFDVEHFSGQTGCIFLAPHLKKLKKKDLGLPHVDEATEQQQKQGMSWSSPDELYNDGEAFKATFRTEEGFIITIIADSYYGYCKKEVKTQLSFACNLLGLCEEEHAGGALVFPSYKLDYSFSLPEKERNGNSLKEAVKLLDGIAEPFPNGYARDKKYPNIFYIPESAKIDLYKQQVSWLCKGKKETLKLLPENHYVYASGYKVRMKKHVKRLSWNLIGTVAEGTLFHKPCTVSGGGKSEISKSLEDAILYKSFYVNNLEEDLALAETIINHDFGKRYIDPSMYKGPKSRSLLTSERSFGSVVKLLTPSPYFTDEYNKWLLSIPHHTRALVLAIKRYYKPSWGNNYSKYFGVDFVDGVPSNELKIGGRKLISSYLRVGIDEEEHWCVYRLRLDFTPAEKLQAEDDITVSVTLPRESFPDFESGYQQPSLKFVENCEYRLFQRPDDAKDRGFDKQTERDFAEPNNFICNFEPLTASDAKVMYEDSIEFYKFTEPMQDVVSRSLSLEEDQYYVSSSTTRIVDGKHTKNPRYLQKRPDMAFPINKHLAEVGIRLKEKRSLEKPMYSPVHAVLIGRRNNPPDKKAGIKPLSVYNPIHYQELPELFMDFVCSLTGKSPSTTGAGSEGAMTKGPFNALRTTPDLNNALIGYILSGYQVFSTPAGYIGHKYCVEHNISMLIPEVWARMPPEERDANFLIQQGSLEKVEDIDYKGKTYKASRLGYRINELFLHNFLGKIFINPTKVFSSEVLKPEEQSMENYVAGLCNIIGAQKRVAQQYIDDGSIEDACPPLKALLHIMASGTWNGMDEKAPAFREMFTLDYLLKSDWYQERLKYKQERDIELYRRHESYLEELSKENLYVRHTLLVSEKQQFVQETLKRLGSETYLKSLVGTIGIDPSVIPLKEIKK